METRFVSGLLEVLFKGFVAKDKSVRYRSVFLVAEMVAHMGELECVLSPSRLMRPLLTPVQRRPLPETAIVPP
jgi:condensin complex subunit 3